jgi:hypothetical protein
MMGRSFDDVEKPSSKPKRRTAEMSDSTATSSGFGFFSIAESSSDAESHSSGNQPSPETDGWVFEASENILNGDEAAQLNFDTTEEETAVVHMPRSAPSTDYVPAPWGLVDPLFKDLGQYSRYYVYHCEIPSA